MISDITLADDAVLVDGTLHVDSIAGRNTPKVIMQGTLNVASIASTSDAGVAMNDGIKVDYISGNTSSEISVGSSLSVAAGYLKSNEFFSIQGSIDNLKTQLLQAKQITAEGINGSTVGVLNAAAVLPPNLPGPRVALVHAPPDQLIINPGGSYLGGVQVQGGGVVIAGSVDVAGDLSITGSSKIMVQNRAPVAASPHAAMIPGIVGAPGLQEVGAAPIPWLAKIDLIQAFLDLRDEVDQLRQQVADLTTKIAHP